MAYTREQPSRRYLELLECYCTMHREGDARHRMAPEKTFEGRSLPRQAHRIKTLIARTNARTVLDYGSGKGTQYRAAGIKQDGVVRWNSIQEYWGVDTIRCYDPAYEPFSQLPEGRFDGVVCTDVLEHCPEEDLDWIVDGLFSFATAFVFATIACFPASRVLPNGENAHCTLRPAAFWNVLFSRAAVRHPGLLWEIWIELSRGGEEFRYANFGAARPSGGSNVWRMV